MKYMNFIDKFVMVAKFNECRCSLINLMSLDFSQICFRYDFIDKLYILINSRILIN
jgi:hypothetical protein